jgi:hypothetical protein
MNKHPNRNASSSAKATEDRSTSAKPNKAIEKIVKLVHAQMVKAVGQTEFETWSVFLRNLISGELARLRKGLTQDEGRWLLVHQSGASWVSQPLESLLMTDAYVEAWTSVFGPISPKAGSVFSRSNPRTDGARRSPQSLNVIAGRGSIPSRPVSEAARRAE